MRKVFLSVSVGVGLLVFSAGAYAQDSGTVRQAQETLKEKGYDPGPVDGIMGPRTRAAVRSYQTKTALNADGALNAETLDSLGVKNAGAKTEMKAAGSTVKNSYAEGGKAIGRGGKALGSDVKHGEVVDGAKDFGKDVGHGAAEIGKGTGHAAKSVAKGVKNTVTRNKDEK